MQLQVVGGCCAPADTVNSNLLSDLEAFVCLMEGHSVFASFACSLVIFLCVALPPLLLQVQHPVWHLTARRSHDIHNGPQLPCIIFSVEGDGLACTNNNQQLAMWITSLHGQTHTQQDRSYLVAALHCTCVVNCWTCRLHAVAT